MARPAPNRAQHAARFLKAAGATGGLMAVLGAWLTLKRTESLPQAASGGELLMVLGLSLAALAGFMGLAHFLGALIIKLERQRQPTRVRDQK